MQTCGQCGIEDPEICGNCHNCEDHCSCPSHSLFDADELGLDPETDNTPKEKSRRA